MPLSDRQYAIVAKVLGGARPIDIADELGTSPAAVTRALHRATDDTPTLGLAIAEARRLHRQYHNAG